MPFIILKKIIFPKGVCKGWEAEYWFNNFELLSQWALPLLSNGATPSPNP